MSTRMPSQLAHIELLTFTPEESANPFKAALEQSEHLGYVSPTPTARSCDRSTLKQERSLRRMSPA